MEEVLNRNRYYQQPTTQMRSSNPFAIQELLGLNNEGNIRNRNYNYVKEESVSSWMTQAAAMAAAAQAYHNNIEFDKFNTQSRGNISGGNVISGINISGGNVNSNQGGQGEFSFNGRFLVS